MANEPNLEKAFLTLCDRADRVADGKKCVWDIIVALRGPDDQEFSSEERKKDMEKLSELTNKRLRFFIGMYPPKDVSKDLHYREEPLELSEQKLRDELLGRCGKHYADHYWSAVEAVRKLCKYDLETETAVKQVSKPTTEIVNRMPPVPSRKSMGEKPLGRFGFYKS